MYIFISLGWNEITRRECRLGGYKLADYQAHADIIQDLIIIKERVCSIASMISEHTQNNEIK